MLSILVYDNICACGTNLGCVLLKQATGMVKRVNNANL